MVVAVAVAVMERIKKEKEKKRKPDQSFRVQQKYKKSVVFLMILPVSLSRCELYTLVMLV